MNAPTAFEPTSVGDEFEIASQEFERNGARRGGSPLQSRARPSLPRRSTAPPRRSQPPRAGRSASPPSRRTRSVPRPDGIYVPWGPWSIDPMPFGQGALYRRCVQSCLGAGDPLPAPEPVDTPVPEPAAPVAPSNDARDDGADSRSHDQEMTMHKPRCQCSQCTPGAQPFEFVKFEPRQAETFEGEGEQQEFEEEGEHEGAFESQYEGPGGQANEAESEGDHEGEFPWQNAGQRGGLFSESEEIALAAELLSVTNEAEFEQFLGGLWSGLRKVGSTVAKAAKPFAGVIRSVTKAALPFVGGALGSLIPIPGVGTAVGSALGGALSKALELEYGELEAEDREFEMARSVVRIAGTAAQNFQPPAPGGSVQAAVQSAIAQAARQHLPRFQLRDGPPSAATRGTWVRQDGKLLVLGA